MTSVSKKEEKIAAVLAAISARDEAKDAFERSVKHLRETVVDANSGDREEKVSLYELSERTHLTVQRLSQFKRGVNG